MKPIILVQRISQSIGKQFGEQWAANPYITPEDIRAYTMADPDNPAPAVVEGAWTAFIGGEFGPFNKSAFHFLLARLGELESNTAVDYAIQTLQQRPEETAYCLRYLSTVLDQLSRVELNRLSE